MSDFVTEELLEIVKDMRNQRDSAKERESGLRRELLRAQRETIKAQNIIVDILTMVNPVVRKWGLFNSAREYAQEKELKIVNLYEMYLDEEK